MLSVYFFILLDKAGLASCEQINTVVKSQAVFSTGGLIVC